MSLVLSTHRPVEDGLPEWVPEWVAGDALLVATLDDIPAGLLALTVEGEAASITYYWVMPELRGLGIGQDLIARALEEARALGASTLEATVSPGDRVAKLAYEALGFRTTSLVVRKELSP